MKRIMHITREQVVFYFEVFRDAYNKDMTEMWGRFWQELFPKTLFVRNAKNMAVVAIQMHVLEVPLSKVGDMRDLQTFLSSCATEVLHYYHVNAPSPILSPKIINEIDVIVHTVNMYVDVINTRACKQ